MQLIPFILPKLTKTIEFSDKWFSKLTKFCLVRFKVGDLCFIKRDIAAYRRDGKPYWGYELEKGKICLIVGMKETSNSHEFLIHALVQGKMYEIRLEDWEIFLCLEKQS